jgi:hypothetical protein
LSQQALRTVDRYTPAQLTELLWVAKLTLVALVALSLLCLLSLLNLPMLPTFCQPFEGVGLLECAAGA